MAENLSTFICRLSGDLGALTSWKATSLYKDYFTFYFLGVKAAGEYG